MFRTFKLNAKKGFTLIELMIVVAIIGVLAAIAIPKFADLLRKSNEGATKGNMGSLRSALTIYYSDMEGFYPLDVNLTGLTNGAKYIGIIPQSKTPPHHSATAAVSDADTATDSGGWAYDNNQGDTAGWGQVQVACSHTDTRSTTWSQY